MKKLFFIAAIACAALASCVKNEVNLLGGSESQKITYQTVINPATKAAFDPAWGFVSYAYMLTDVSIVKNWATNYAEATSYFEEALISTEDGGVTWKNATTEYYWPKGDYSYLTFFAWADGKATPSVSGVSCDATTGIKATDYSVVTNKNVDFLVADVAADKQYAGEGTKVTTIFHHVLSKLSFNVGLQEQYSGHTFTLKSLTLTGVNTKATYTQCKVDAATNYDKVTDPSSWGTPSENSTPLSTFAGDLSITGVTPNPTPVVKANDDYEIMLPQPLSDTQTLTIVYEHTFGASTETVTEVIKFVDGSAKLFGSESWEPGKQYNLNIYIGLNPIRWAPEVTDWSPIAGTDQKI